MLRFSLTTMLVVGIGITGAACQDDGSATPRGYNQPAPTAYYRYGYGPQQAQGWPPNQADGRRYTTVTVTNRGQNGNRDEVVQQQVVGGSQYYDGYRTRTARC